MHKCVICGLVWFGLCLYTCCMWRHSFLRQKSERVNLNQDEDVCWVVWKMKIHTQCTCSIPETIHDVFYHSRCNPRLSNTECKLWWYFFRSLSSCACCLPSWTVTRTTRTTWCGSSSSRTWPTRASGTSSTSSSCAPMTSGEMAVNGMAIEIILLAHQSKSYSVSYTIFLVIG